MILPRLVILPYKFKSLGPFFSLLTNRWDIVLYLIITLSKQSLSNDSSEYMLSHDFSVESKQQKTKQNKTKQKTK